MTGKKVKFFTTKRACLVILCFLFCVATVLFCISIRPTHSVYANETTGYLFKDGAGVIITDPLAGVEKPDEKAGTLFVANANDTYDGDWGGTAKNKIYDNNILLYSSPTSAIPHLSVANITFNTPLLAANVKQIVLKISARFPDNYGTDSGHFHRFYAVNEDGTLKDTEKYISLQGVSHGNSYQLLKLENASVLKLANSDGYLKTIQYNGSYASGDYSEEFFGFFIESISYELYSGNEDSENLITLYSKLYSNQYNGHLFDGTGVTLSDPIANGGVADVNYKSVSGLSYCDAYYGGLNTNTYANGMITLYSGASQAGINSYSIVNMTFANKITDVRRIKSMSIKIEVRNDGGANNYNFLDKANTHKLYAVNDDGTIGGSIDIADISGIQQNVGEQTLTLSAMQISALANSNGEIETIQWSGHHSSYVNEWNTYVYIKEISYTTYTDAEYAALPNYFFGVGSGVTLSDPIANGGVADVNYKSVSGLSYLNAYYGGLNTNTYANGMITLYSGASQADIYSYSIVNMTFANKITDVRRIKSMSIKIEVKNDGGANNYNFLDKANTHKLYAVNDDGTIGGSIDIADISGIQQNVGEQTLTLSAMQIFALANSNGEIETIQWSGHHSSYAREWNTYVYIKEISYTTYTDAEYAALPNYFFGVGSGVTLSDPIANGGVADVNYKSVSGLSYNGNWGGLNKNTYDNGMITLYSAASQADIYSYSIVNMTFANKITDVRRIKSMSIKIEVKNDGGANNHNFLDKANTHKLYAVNDDGTIGGSIDIADISGIQQNVGEQTLTLSAMQIFALANSNGEIETIQWSGHHSSYVREWNSYVYIKEISYTTYTDAEYAALPNYFYGVGSGVTLSDPCINGTDGVNYDMSSLGLSYNGGEYGGLNKNYIDSGKIVLYSAANQAVVGEGSVVNLTFQNKLPNAKKIKSMTFKIQIDCDNGANNYPFLAGNNIHRFYAVNADGTLTGTYMDLADIPEIASNAGEQTVTIDRTQIMKLANSDGAIETIQWSGHHSSYVSTWNAYVTISEITYEEYTDAEVEALPEIVFTGSEVEITDPWANGTPVAGVNYDPVKGLSYSGDWGNTKHNTITDGKLQLWSGDDQADLPVYSIANIKFKNKIKNVDLLKEMSIKIWVKSDDGALNYPFLVEDNTHVLYGLNNDGTLTGKCLNIAEITGIKENEGVQILTITHDQALKLADSDGEIENIQWSGHHYNHVNTWNTYVWIYEITYNYYTLEEMKAIYSTKLDSYKQSDYSASDWLGMYDIISQYKSDVNSATEISVIPTLLSNAKTALSSYSLGVNKITGRYISLGNSISVYTRATYVGQKTPVMRFVIEGVAEKYVNGYVVDGNTYEFVFTGIGPQSLTDTIKAYLFEGEGEEIAGYTEIAYKEFTVIDYLNTAFENACLNAEKTLISDIVEYGYTSQLYTGHNTSNMPSLKGATPSTFQAVGTDYNLVTNNYEEGTCFVGAKLEFSNTNRLVFLFMVNGSIANYKVDILLNNQAVSKQGPIEDNGNYKVYTSSINPMGFDDVYTVKLSSNNGTVIQTLTYSIKSYVYSKQGLESNMATLAKALYKYGISAKNYLNLKSGAYTVTTKRTPEEVHSVSFEAIGGKDVMPVGGFWGPYGGFNNDVYFEYLKAAGINTILSTGNYDINEFMNTLELCEEYGMGAFLTSSMVTLWSQGANGLSAGNLEYALRALENDACLGVYGIDEPFQNWFDSMGEVYDLFYNVCDFGEKQIVTNFVGHNTTRPSTSGGTVGELTFEEELEDFINECSPNLLCFDSYVFTNNRLMYQKKKIQNAGYKDYFAELSIVSNLAKENNIPFWYILQAGCSEIGNSTIEQNESEFDWNINTALAYGAKGIMYFPLFQPEEFYDDGQGNVNGLISATGARNDWYYYAENIAGQLSAIDAVLMNSENMGLICNISNSTELGWIANKDKIASFRELNTVSGGDAMVGCFDYQGKTALYVVNFSRTAEQTIGLNFNGNYGYNIIRNGEGSFETGTALSLTLNAGEGVLVVLD